MAVSASEVLPVGSVIELKGVDKRLMVIGIYQSTEESGDRIAHDYIGVPYPEGYIGEEYQYVFQHEDIEKVHFRGFIDSERQMMIAGLEDADIS